MTSRLPRSRCCLLLIGAILLACYGSEGPTPSRTAGGRSSSSAADALQGRDAQRPAPRRSAPGGAQCGGRSDPVIVTVVDGPGAVRERRARPEAPIVSEDPETVVFADGQIVTSRLDEVGEHLGRLGWIDREIVISSPYQRRGGLARRRRG